MNIILDAHHFNFQTAEIRVRTLIVVAMNDVLHPLIDLSVCADLDLRRAAKEFAFQV